MKTKINKAAIIAVGDELLRNQVREINSVNLTAELKKIMITPDAVIRIGDSEKAVSDALDMVADYELVIVTGGLGPTGDDVTLKAVMDYYSLRGVVDPHMWDYIKARLISCGVDVSASNKKQAILPEKGRFIHNDNGTAPGVIIRDGDQNIILLPGPPGENLPMFRKECLPMLQEMTGKQLNNFLETVYICDVPESRIADDMKNIDTEGLDLGIYFSEEGWISVEMRCGGDPGSRKKADAVASYLKDKYDELAVRGCTPAECLFRLLKQKGLTISIAESLTGGYGAWSLVKYPGASELFNGGATVYSNRSKTAILDVPEQLIMENGAVSEETAKAMAEGCLNKFETDCALAFTGIAGPSGGVTGKPAGTVYTAFAIQEMTYCAHDVFTGNRERVVKKAVAKAFCRLIALLS